MKILLSLFLCLHSLAFAGFETWTNSDGRTATMNLLEVTERDGSLVGRFSLRSGRILELGAEELAEEGAERLVEFKNQQQAEPGTGPQSVFDESLDGELVQLDGKRLKRFDSITRPEKYYVFYYTASWCGPCQRFTPGLVRWYEANRNKNFELVLISSDSSDEAMEGYARDKKMPWPQLELRKVKSFRTKFDHGVRGIPSLIVCKLDGTMLGNYRSRLDELTTLVTASQ